MVSIIWNPKFGGQGIIYQYILNLHNCTFEHGRILGTGNLKNRYKAMQNVRFPKSEKEVTKKRTKNVISSRGCSQKSDDPTQLNFEPIFSATSVLLPCI